MPETARLNQVKYDKEVKLPDLPPTLRIENFTRFKSLEGADIDQEMTLTVKGKVTDISKHSGENGYTCLTIEISGIKMSE